MTRSEFVPVTWYPDIDPDLLRVASRSKPDKLPRRPPELLPPRPGRVDYSADFLELANIDPAEWRKALPFYDPAAPTEAGVRLAMGGEFGKEADEEAIAFGMATARMLAPFWESQDLGGVFWRHDPTRPSLLSAIDAYHLLKDVGGWGLAHVHFDVGREEVDVLRDLLENEATIEVSPRGDEDGALVGLYDPRADEHAVEPGSCIGTQTTFRIDLGEGTLVIGDGRYRRTMTRLWPETFRVRFAAVP